MSDPQHPHVPTPAALTSRGAVSAISGAGLGVLGAWLLHLGARDAAQVEWECAVSTCGTNDVAGTAPMLGVLALALAGVLLARTVRTLAAPLMVLVGTLAMLLGWRSAIEQRLVTIDNVTMTPLLGRGRGWLVVVGLVGVVALVLTVLAAVRELRQSSGYWVLLGRRATWGRVADYENTGEDPTATVHFADENGTRYSVRMPVPREAFQRPPRVYYDPVSPTDPDRLRIGMPGAPLTAGGRDEQLAAARLLLPLPGDDEAVADRTTMSIAADGTRTTTSMGPGGTRTATVAPDGTRTVTTVAADGTRAVRSTQTSTETISDVTAALERLSELHRSGALSDDEFAAAKAAVLRR
ncbi:SHOCT domain-containing protein [Cellulomonas sp. RIT-PI-Y]|uniref:SHOCT domain-containing protein n=1 Tax=Cellulomonas sp. RIT-PI-Y TaxID=3035297 RepID=UPI0021D9D363|nr:SHOCT domain-containing protein [Cellulomonas sp. RIT-PI-Y]